MTLSPYLIVFLDSFRSFLSFPPLPFLFLAAFLPSKFPVTLVPFLSFGVYIKNPLPKFNLKFIFSFPSCVDVEFKLIYVGSAESESYDQVLDSVFVGPIPVGISKFVLQVMNPNLKDRGILG